MIYLLKHYVTWRHLFLAQTSSLVGTGISNIALALLAWELAGENAGEVLGTAFAIKMIAYVFLAPVAGALTSRVDHKQILIALDLARAGLIFLLPFVTQVWQVYLLIFMINSCSAAFTPTFQSVIPRVLPKEDEYLKALSLSRVAYDLEQLASPLLTAVLLATLNARDLFYVNSMTFLISAIFIYSCTIPLQDEIKQKQRIVQRLTSGIRLYLGTPRLRALWCLYFSVASGSAMLIVNTVVYIKDVLQLEDKDAAFAMAVAGSGSMLIALCLPSLIKKYTVRPFMFLGGFCISLALIAGTTMPGLMGFLVICLLIGIGLSMVQTPAGQLIKQSCHNSNASMLFAAHFSLSHLCWFFTYLLAGWSSSQWGMVSAWWLMAMMSVMGCLVGLRVYPNSDQEEMGQNPTDVIKP